MTTGQTRYVSAVDRYELAKEEYASLEALLIDPETPKAKRLQITIDMASALEGAEVAFTNVQREYAGSTSEQQHAASRDHRLLGVWLEDNRRGFAAKRRAFKVLRQSATRIEVENEWTGYLEVFEVIRLGPEADRTLTRVIETTDRQPLSKARDEYFEHARVFAEAAMLKADHIDRTSP